MAARFNARSRWGSLQRSPDPIAGLRERGRKRERRRGERNEKDTGAGVKEGREEKGKEMRGGREGRERGQVWPPDSAARIASGCGGREMKKS